jgi:CRP/FNR family transcriptional regulator, cyclic AMP receptor protein
MKTILFIGDTAEILDNFAEYLEMEGYKVLGSNNRKKGIELAIEHLPDIIICDMLMPEMDGHEVLRLLLETAKVFEIPFIFSTSLSKKVDKEGALALGADDYIIKPFDLETLLKMIKTLLKSGSKRLKVENV